jgi:uncharacterized protein
MIRNDVQTRLLSVLDGYQDIAIAISGGVDSMVLAYMAHRYSRTDAQMIHAISPAVPPHATKRVQDYAARENWRLTVADAGEFSDPAYRANPVNRCYFCKSNLYRRIGNITKFQIASGTNLDDLGDFRPGLTAAEENKVVHPYVEAEITKAEIFALARNHQLLDLAELPAQPCLSSRVETGIAINADDLAFVDLVESGISNLFPAGVVVRCRITHKGVIVELGEGAAETSEVSNLVRNLCEDHGRSFVGLRPYRRGAAFIGNHSAGSPGYREAKSINEADVAGG